MANNKSNIVEKRIWLNYKTDKGYVDEYYVVLAGSDVKIPVTKEEFMVNEIDKPLRLESKVEYK